MVMSKPVVAVESSYSSGRNPKEQLPVDENACLFVLIEVLVMVQVKANPSLLMKEQESGMRRLKALAGYKGVEKADKMVKKQSFGTCSLHDDAYKMRL